MVASRLTFQRLDFLLRSNRIANVQHENIRLGRDRAVIAHKRTRAPTRCRHLKRHLVEHIFSGDDRIRRNTFTAFGPEIAAMDCIFQCSTVAIARTLPMAWRRIELDDADAIIAR